MLKCLLFGWYLILDSSPNIPKSWLIYLGLILGQIIRQNILPKQVLVGPYTQGILSKLNYTWQGLGISTIFIQRYLPQCMWPHNNTFSPDKTRTMHACVRGRSLVDREAYSNRAHTTMCDPVCMHRISLEIVMNDRRANCMFLAGSSRPAFLGGGLGEDLDQTWGWHRYKLVELDIEID